MGNMKAFADGGHRNLVWVTVTLAVLAAGTPEPALAEDNEWITHGPEGGYVQLLAIDPQNPEVLYIVGSFSNFGPGLLKTSHGGSHWTGLTAPSWTVSTLVIDPQAPNILYAIAGYGLLFKSVDGGASWSQLPIPGNSNRSTFNAIAIDPKNPSTLYASWSNGGMGAGVLKSSDGGASWNEVNSGLIDLAHPHVSIGALAVDPQTGHIYASGFFAIFKSSDAGMSWRQVFGGDWLPYTIGPFVVDPQNAGTVYALAGSGGVLKSTDNGETWITLPLPKTSNGSDLYVNVTAFTLDAENPNTVYCALTMQQVTSSGGAVSHAVIVSTDGGFTWTDISQGFPGGVPEIQRLAAASPPKFSARRIESRGSLTRTAIYASTLGDGILKTVDGGMHWIPESSGIMAVYIVALAMDPQNPDTIYASGYGGGVYKSTDMGASWAGSGWPGGQVFGLGVDPQNSETVYAADCQAVYRSADGGAHWTRLDAGGCSVNFDSQNPGTVYTELGKSTDGGATWTKFIWPSGVYVCCSTSSRAVATDPQHSGTIYTGAIDGRVLKSVDGGTNWSVINSA
jgi:photosystem II stability/assembly factor-like uncharacterized protein